MFIDFRNRGGGEGPSVNVEALTVTANGKYEAPEGTAYTPVDVNVAIPTFETEELVAVENKVYTPTKDGFSKVTVNVASEGSFKYDTIGYDIADSARANSEYETLHQSRIDEAKPLYDAWDPSRVDASSYFSHKDNLYYMPKIDTSNVTNFRGFAFEDKSLNMVPTLNTSRAIDMYQMFYGCSGLTSVPLFDTSKVANMHQMFWGCESLTSVPLFDTSNATDMSQMFYSCKAITSVPLFNTSKVIDMSQMFFGCKLETIPLFDTSKVADFDGMFYLSSIKEIPTIDTSSAVNMRSMFDSTNITTIPRLNTSKVTNMKNMFSGCQSLKSIPELDVPNVENMESMFYNCRSLTAIPALNTSKVTNMKSMFNYCSNLKSIGDLDTSKVTDMTSMFGNCSNLETVPTIDISSLKNGLSSLLSQTKVKVLEFKGKCVYTGYAGGIVPYGSSGVFFYPSEFKDSYTIILNAIPSEWKKIAVGDPTLVSIKILKDGNWLSGEQPTLTIGGVATAYAGKGIYTATLPISKENFDAEITPVMLNGAEIGKVKVKTDVQSVYTGDNSSVLKRYVGADILTIKAEPTEWYYDETVKGVRSNKIAGGQTTSIKLNIKGNVAVKYGQDSETNYDYATLYGSTGTEIVSFKGKETGPTGTNEWSGNIDAQPIEFRYIKDSSGDKGLDAFWIKEIRSENLPPLPEV